MMRAWPFFALLAVGVLLISSCKAPRPKPESLILTSIHPYELLVRQLVGDSIQVQTLLPPNASPHNYSPRPSDLKAISDCSLFISNGLDLEHSLQQSLKQIGGKHVEIAELLQPDLAPNANPHFWLSPQLLIQITLKLSDELQSRFPALASTIGANTAELVRQLSALHLQISQERSTYSDPGLITYHDSFEHFMRDYGIADLGSVQSSPGREPTAGELTELGKQIKAHRVKAIMVEPQLDRKSARVLANEFKLQLVELDPLGYSFKPATVMDIVLNNWERMKLAW